MSLHQRSTDPTVVGKGALAVSRWTGLTVAQAKGLLLAREVISTTLDTAPAVELAAALTEAGFAAHATPAPSTSSPSCSSHPHLDSEARCVQCEAPICGACVVNSRGPRCAGCEAKRRRSRRRSHARTVVLLVVLLGVAGWALVRERRRDARTKWTRPLSISVVLVATEPIPPAAVARWTKGLESLEAWFTREWERYRPVMPFPMVGLTLDGAVQVERFPVFPGEANDLPERVAETVAFDRELHAIEVRLAPHPKRDATIYVLLRPTAEGGGIVEGVAEAGGVRGVIDGSLDDENLALELCATAHELLHFLGATDKYGPDGHALAQGLTEPGSAEVMVGEVSLGPGQGKPLTRLDEVLIGPTTAREIHW